MGKKVKQKGVCCNPFHDQNHQKYVFLFDITKTLVAFAKKRKINLKLNQKICKACRHKIYCRREFRDENTAERIVDQPSTSSGITAARSSCQSAVTDMDYVDSLIGFESSSNDDDDFAVDEVDIEAVKKCTNELLYHLDLNKLDETKVYRKSYQLDLFNNLTTRLGQCLFSQVSAVINSNIIVEQLKDKFKQTVSRDVKMKILSLLPKEWSFRTIQSIFNASFYMINQSKKLVEKYGILCDTTKKLGMKIPENTVKKVKEFYCSDEISRACPGLRDFVKFYDENGEKVKVQRRLILMNLREAYEMFKIQNQNEKIGFSKFASLRPPECVLANSTHGIHTTCVCIYHQNVKLIFHALQKNEIVDQTKTYRELMQMLLCSESNDNCRLNKCILCPGIDGNDQQEGLRLTLLHQFEDKLIEKITFKQWMNAGS